MVPNEPNVPEGEVDREDEFYEAKKQALERIFGPMADTVSHGIIPFFMGGMLDLYYFSEYLPGTVIATMELINPDGRGPERNRLGVYEFIACTRKTIAWSTTDLRKPAPPDETTDFERVVARAAENLTSLGHYSHQTVLQPRETCEFPKDENGVGRYFVLDAFDTRGVAFEVEGKAYGLLLCIEIHESELRFAQKKGGKKLLKKLKEAGAYPYSDLDRNPVV